MHRCDSARYVGALLSAQSGRRQPKSGQVALPPFAGYAGSGLRGLVCAERGSRQGVLPHQGTADPHDRLGDRGLGRRRHVQTEC
jgi:hypothetical protein